MLSLMGILAIGIIAITTFEPLSWGAHAWKMPKNAQRMDMKNALINNIAYPVGPTNDSSRLVWPGLSHEQLLSKPFHVYAKGFYRILRRRSAMVSFLPFDAHVSSRSSLTFYPPTHDVFWVKHTKNDSYVQFTHVEAIEGTGMGSSIKNSIFDAKIEPRLASPRGSTTYKKHLLYVADVRDGSKAIFILERKKRFVAKPFVTNYFGRPFKSITAMLVHPRGHELYFTGTLCDGTGKDGSVPSACNHVFRYSIKSGEISVVADGFTNPRGLVFSANAYGRVVYVTDAGAVQNINGQNVTTPATIYQYFVGADDSTWASRKLFAHVGSSLIEDITIDIDGRVYAACDDGVHVWNQSGKFLGKIYTGSPVTSLTWINHFTYIWEPGLVIASRQQLFFANLDTKGVKPR